MGKEKTLMNLHEMKLHETTIIDSYTEAMRVPGGWRYITTVECSGDSETSISTTSTFVPYSKEFSNMTIKDVWKKNDKTATEEINDLVDEIAERTSIEAIDDLI